MAEIVKGLGVGLSVALRYSYGGFLLIVLAAIVSPAATGKVLTSMGWELAGLAAVVIGAGIYAIHRSVVIPIHHLGLCTLLWIRDIIFRVKAEGSNSPTRWLCSVGVKWQEQILAYTAVRRSDFFGSKKDKVDLAHAESGLVVMTSEGFIAAAFYAKYHPTMSPFSSVVWFALAAVCLIASYPSGWVQHQRECREMRFGRLKVEEILRSEGLLV